MGLLDGKIALVTGAGTGIGRETAILLAHEGATAILTGRRIDPLQDVVTLIEKAGGKAVARALDVASRDAIVETVAWAKRHVGPIDILVNNAGIAVSKPLLEHSEEDWDRVLDTNLKGAWLMSRELASRWLELKLAGRIINISSLLALRTSRSVPSYAAAKAGLDHLTRTMAVELGRFGITVNAIAPGYVETDMNRDFLRSNTGKALIARIPAGRVGAPDDLDGALLLLASPAGAYLNGVVLPVDGGHAVSVI
jgi:NAD(P)-dependent dehydrogenase (short-subunit alcohol dehydrogenase family)